MTEVTVTVLPHEGEERTQMLQGTHAYHCGNCCGMPRFVVEWEGHRFKVCARHLWWAMYGPPEPPSR